MPAMPKFSTSTFATAGERKAGRVGPRWMFFTPSDNPAPYCHCYEDTGKPANILTQECFQPKRKEAKRNEPI